MGTHQHAILESNMTAVNVMAASNTNEAAKKRTCTAIIWLKNDSDERAKEAIATTLQSLSGVSEVHYVREKPCIMMVDYCRHQVKATNLIGAINIHGGCARIVGC